MYANHKPKNRYKRPKLNKTFLFLFVFVVLTLGYFHVLTDGLVKKHKAGVETAYESGYEQAVEEYKNDYRMAHEIMTAFYEHTDNSFNQYVLSENRIRKIIAFSNPSLDEKVIQEYIVAINKWSRHYELSPIFVAAVIHKESNFKKNAVSKIGCRGPLQVYPKFHKEKLKEIGIKSKDLHDIDHGIHIGTMILKEYLMQCDYDYRAALTKFGGFVNSDSTDYVNGVFEVAISAYK